MSKKKINNKGSIKKSDDIPYLTEKYDVIKKYLLKNNNLSMILIDASKTNNIKFHYGSNVYEDTLFTLKKIVSKIKGKQIRKDDIITINYQKGDQFYIFLSKKRGEKSFKASNIENTAIRIHSYINDNIYQTTNLSMKEWLKINVGYATTIYNPLIEGKLQLDKLIEDAKVMANHQEYKSNIIEKEKLQELIIEQKINTVFQPIVELNTYKIIGYEALSRGPKGTEFENPYTLFNLAKKTGILFELDRICRKQTFLNTVGIGKNKKLFINILPVSIQDPEFKGKFLKNILNNIKLSPHSIVLEVSEQHAIENLSIFKKESKYYTDLGFAIALDDTGTGYSNLKALCEMKLDYIKLDISLIHNLNRNILKQEIVKSLINIAKNIKSLIIAEGIETKGELKTLIDLGIPYGQGFLFARPSSPFPEINKF